MVFDDNPRRDCIVFTVQIWHTRGPEPEFVAQVFMRQKDILFGSRSTSQIVQQANLHHMRHIVRELVDMLPEERKNTLEVQELAGWGCATTMHLIEINARQSTARLMPETTTSRKLRFKPVGRPDMRTRTA